MAFPRPEGYHSITPGAAVPNGAEVLDFIENVFDGKTIERYDAPDGTLAHAEVMIGDSAFQIGTGPEDSPPFPAMLVFYVDSADKVDELYQKALEAGATSQAEPTDQFYGWRTATVMDMGGNGWTIFAVVEQLTPEEMNERVSALEDDS
ncbi:MAG: VOC family protein [Gammaproteobacteria bacterium]|nr:VOC family protein [Gammaproteobacteria bacterium]